MSDELDPVLRRMFAQANTPIEAEPFTTDLVKRLAAQRGLRFGAAALTAILGTVLNGFLNGLKPARLLLVGAAAVTLWVSFL
ncbi:MAG: hypothetical protein JSS29_06760 [Proteobacteria bacterium]|nr:hypothetical protein [Pseudomonadota bacterium]